MIHISLFLIGHSRCVLFYVLCKIDAMEDGAEKTLAQMALTHAREKQELIREKEDFLQAKKDAARELFEANPENEGKIFDASGIKLTPQEEESFNQKTINQEKRHQRETEEANKQVLEDMLGDYRAYESQRLKVKEKFAKERAKSKLQREMVVRMKTL